MEEKLHFKDVAKFPVSFWLLCLVCSCFYAGIFNFYAIASSIMQFSGRRRYEADVASSYVSIPNIMAIFLIPCAGYVLDRWGRALWAVSAATLLVMLALLLALGNALSWWQVSPVAVMVCMGLGYAMGAAAIWPLVPHLVPQRAVTTAYGVVSSIQAIGLAVSAQIVGAIQAASSGAAVYAAPLYFLLSAVLIAGCLSLLLSFLDARFRAGFLNLSASRRIQRALSYESIH